MMKSHLGIYSDWVKAAEQQAGLYPLALPGEETRRQIRNILGFSKATPVAEHARIETTWKRDGLAGEAISWSVGYGPRTQAIGAVSHLLPDRSHNMICAPSGLSK